MEAPDRVYIVAKPFKHGTRNLNFADVYERQRLGLSDETDRTFRKIRQVVPLTRESYANAIAHRERGAVGAGFTLEYLLEHGIVDEDKAQQSGFFPHGAETYKGYWVVTRPVSGGRLKKYEVLNLKHEPMRDTKFNTADNARAFIDTLPAAEEGSNDVFLRQGALEPA